MWKNECTAEVKLSTKEKIKTIVDFMVNETGLTNFGEWLTALLEFDQLILNEDRHPHNIAVIRKTDGTYKLMPFFDNGAAFCSDTTRDYPLSMPLNVCMRSVKAMPFNSSFQRQVNACRELFERQLVVHLNPQDITKSMIKEFDCYPPEIKNRVINILKIRLD